ncbi:hypothetical protein M9978_02385 [Sphingomonas sp. MG17]|uniref:Uncharacterized protein n=1 Tax=Sphingomonas tagetis TaxID=2949092 RepID=A0A9X2KJA7_9SPHN|nr:hypothetical protein [Sphingomonas tagetis]MCP3729264.1 hypothetical protein [Sphingomonas tagetis]
MLDNLLRAAVGAATMPLDLAADVVTLGGALTDRDEPYTATKARSVMANVADATKRARP